jgi:hypothetical protein
MNTPQQIDGVDVFVEGSGSEAIVMVHGRPNTRHWLTPVVSLERDCETGRLERRCCVGQTKYPPFVQCTFWADLVSALFIFSRLQLELRHYPTGHWRTSAFGQQRTFAAPNWTLV